MRKRVVIPNEPSAEIEHKNDIGRERESAHERSGGGVKSRTYVLTLHTHTLSLSLVLVCRLIYTGE